MQLLDSLVQVTSIASNISLILGVPLTLITLAQQERKERENEQQKIYDAMMGHYASIQDKLFAHPEIDQHTTPLNDSEDVRRQRIVYEMLISLFERAYIMLSDETAPAYQRMWNSWVDYIHLWVDRPNFRILLPQMMRGEDPAFVHFMAQASAMDLEP
jgi:hypothetical protein